VTNRSKDLGSIDAGKFADLVLLNADPLADIHNTSKIEAVIVDGKLLRRADLDVLLREGERAAAGN
jgi:imidazolonepropionase-like amidohydrolase